MSFLAELKRRNVIRVGIAYLVASWLLLQMVDVLAPMLELPGWAPRLILLILAVGFIPVIVFSWAFELTPEGIKRESEVVRSESITNLTAKKLDYITIALVVAAIAVVAIDRFLPRATSTSPQAARELASSQAGEAAQDNEGRTLSPTGRQAAQNAVERVSRIQPQAAENPPPTKSIAVLPFVNMSDDAANEYFSDGISEEILNALAKVKELKVAGRTSSFAFKGESQDLRQIGATLGVRNILEGSVRKAGDRVRITAQLIQVDDGFHLWSESYDRELDDIFAIQDEIAQAILVELKAKLLGGEQITATQTQTAAYESYLLARQRIYERTESSLQRAIQLLDEAIAIDPEYAPAYAQRAIATFLLSDRMYGTIPDVEAKTQGKVFVDRALELDARQPEALAAKGYYLTEFNIDRAEGIEAFREALAINPNLTDASLWLGMELQVIGELQAAARTLQTAYARDPLHRALEDNFLVTFVLSGQNDKVISLLGSTAAESGDNYSVLANKAWLNWLQGNFAASLRLSQSILESEPSNTVTKRDVGFGFLELLEPGRALEIDTPTVRILALQRLGRSEEATILGYEQASKSRLEPEFFQILVENGEYGKLVEFVESRWPDLDDFEDLYPERNGMGSPRMGLIAEAYGNLGNEAKFNDTMSRFKASLDQQAGQGANNPYLHFSQAIYAVLSGDHDTAIDLLEEVFTHSGGFGINYPGAWPVFEPLKGDPRYEQAKAGLMQHINEERRKLGWEPVST